MIVQIGRKILAVQHQQIAVAYAGVERYLIGTEFLLQIFHKDPRLGFVQMPGGVIQQHPFGGNCNEIAPPRNIIRSQFNTLTYCFDGAAARIVLFGVKTQHRHICYIAGSRQTIRQGKECTASTIFGNAVHGRSFGVFHRGFAAEFGYGQICHAVS